MYDSVIGVLFSIQTDEFILHITLFSHFEEITHFILILNVKQSYFFQIVTFFLVCQRQMINFFIYLFIFNYVTFHFSRIFYENANIEYIKRTNRASAFKSFQKIF